MTAEGSEEEIAESVPAGSVASDCEKRDDEIRASEMGEGESESRRSADHNPESEDLAIANPPGSGSEDEQSHRVEKKGEADQETYGDLDNDNGEEAEYCPFCLYMKSGECGDSWAQCEECVNEAERESVNVVEKCVRVTRFLTQCMRANPEHYGPSLEAEKTLAGDIRYADDLEVASEQAGHTIGNKIRFPGTN